MATKRELWLHGTPIPPECRASSRTRRADREVRLPPYAAERSALHRDLCEVEETVTVASHPRADKAGGSLARLFVRTSSGGKRAAEALCPWAIGCIRSFDDMIAEAVKLRAIWSVVDSNT